MSRIFQEMAEQGHYAGAELRHTRQGIYICTADGEFLTSTRPEDADSVLVTMKRGLKAWSDRPENHGSSLTDLESVAAWEDFYPVHGLVLKVTVRHLNSKKSTEPGQRSLSGARSASLANRSNFDHVWFSKTESLEWVPEKLEVGEGRQLQDKLVERLVCLHLVDSISARLPVRFRREDVGGAWIRTEIVSLEQHRAHLRISGQTLAHAPNRELRSSANRVETLLLGYATFNTVSEAFERFEVIALGRGTDFRAFAPDSASSRDIGFALTLEPQDQTRTPPHFIHRYEGDWVIAAAGIRKVSAKE